MSELSLRNQVEMVIPSELPSTVCVLRALRYSNALSARYYGLPVFLVGGAISDPEPRDIDIVIPVPEELFVAMYGDEGTEQQWRLWARDCAKQGREMTMYCRRQVDFKTQPQKMFDEFVGRRVRLDNWSTI